jgi:proteasome assembly chaperone (PAC2) family protein
VAAATVTGVELIRWSQRPDLRSPVLLVAWEGWNDAGDAASTAARHIRDRLGGEAFAELDPEAFYDFTSTRPNVVLDDEGQRRVLWPENTFWAVTPQVGDRDLVVLTGIEPQLRWRTYCDAILRVADELGADLVVSLGALIAEVAHSRPTTVFGAAYDTTLAERLALAPSRYEGPTGIVGVFHDACRQRGLGSVSLWATVPTYVPHAPSPKAALALVERVADLLTLRVPTAALEVGSAAYERQISELVADDDETAAYVSALEQQFDEEHTVDDADQEVEGSVLVEEVERFLRDQG